MILLYLGEQASQKDAFIHIFEQLSFSYRFIEDDATASSLNALFEQTDHPQAPQPLAHPLLVMKDIDDAQFQLLMEALKEAGLTIERKAMWTKHNQHWSFVQLAQEIEEEHQYFADIEALYALFEESNQLDPNCFTKSSWEAYARILTNLYMQLQQQPSAETVKNMLRQAQEAKEQLKRNEERTLS